MGAMMKNKSVQNDMAPWQDLNINALDNMA